MVLRDCNGYLTAFSKLHSKYCIIDFCVRYVFDVAQHSPVHCAQYVQGVLQSIQEEFVQRSEKKGTLRGMKHAGVDQAENLHVAALSP